MRASPLRQLLAIGIAGIALALPAQAGEKTVKWDLAAKGGGAGTGMPLTFAPTANGPLKDALTAAGKTKLTFADKGTEGWDYTGLPADAFKGFVGFGSVDNTLGAVHRNTAGAKIEDVHITLEKAGDFFDKGNAANTGGNAFTTVSFKNPLPGQGANPTKYSTIEFSGGNIAQDSFLWSRISELAQGDAKGLLTPQAVPKAPPAPKPAGNLPATGNDGNGGAKPKTDFSPGPTPGSGSFSFSGGGINFVRYADGSVFNPLETLVGAEVLISPTPLAGLPGSIPTLPSAYALGDTDLLIRQGSNTFVRGALTDIFLIPDASTPGFDSLLQATLLWDYYSGALASPLLDQLYDPESPARVRTLFLHANLLSETANLSQATTPNQGFGALTIAAVPVPEAVPRRLLGLGLLALWALAWRRGRDGRR